MDINKVKDYTNQIEQLVVRIKSELGTATPVPDPLPPTSVRIRVGDNLQAAFDAAKPGTLLVADPGEYKLNLKLLKKNSLLAPIVLTTSADASNFSLRKNDFGYVDPEMRAAMPSIVGVELTDYVIQAPINTGGYRFQNVHIPSTGRADRSLVGLGDDKYTDPSQKADGFEFIDCFLGSTDLSLYQHRGIESNCGYLKVKGTYIGNIAEIGRDAQAICGWNGMGPFVIENSYLEASGENVMFGGGTAMSPGNAPSDITVRGNHIRKNPEWRNMGEMQPSVKISAELVAADDFSEKRLVGL